MKAFLLLEDGHLFTGQSIGAPRDVLFEAVFNTSMTGYAGLLTDPSYAGQGVVMTYPLVGNCGISPEDEESKRPWVSAFILREIARTVENPHSGEDLSSYLVRHNIPGIAGVDTRALAKVLREKGSMNAFLTTNPAFDRGEAMLRTAAYCHGDLVERVTSKTMELHLGDGHRVALLDFGAKLGIVRCLTKRGCEVTTYPAETPISEILGAKPHGIILSSGPGDPRDCAAFLPGVEKLVHSGTPLFAIGLGHQLVARSLGIGTGKLTYGHRGDNQPVCDTRTGCAYITSQSHGYCVSRESLPTGVEITYENINDGTVEGLRLTDYPVFSVQFRPEASPGPGDTEFLFDQFIDAMGGAEHAAQ